MVGPPRLSWSFLANPSAKVTLLHGDLARPGQVKELGNVVISRGNGKRQRSWISPGLGN